MRVVTTDTAGEEPAGEGRTLSVVICSRDRSVFLDRCLTALAAVDGIEGAEVVVVDNGSTDGTAAVAERWADVLASVRYVHEARVGLSHARNRGIDAATGDVIAFLDDDVLVDQHWLVGVRSAYHDAHGIAGTAGRVELEWPAGRPSWLSERREVWFAKLDLGDEPRLLDQDEYPVGANMSVRRSLAVAAGGFDPALGYSGSRLLGNEEREFFDRVRRRGAELAYAPAASVRHVVEGDRVTRRYLVKRMYAQGRSDVRMVSCRGHDGFRQRLGMAGQAFARALLRGWRDDARRLIGTESRGAAVVDIVSGRAKQLGVLREALTPSLRGSRSSRDEQSAPEFMTASPDRRRRDDPHKLTDMQRLIARLAQRGRRGLRRHGAVGLVAHAVRVLGRRIGRDRNIVFVHTGRPAGVELPSSVTVTRYASEADLPDVVRSEIIGEIGAHRKTSLSREFTNGGSLWVAIEAERLAACQWSVRGSSLGRWFVELRPDDIVLYSAVTVPASRGRGIAASLSCAIIDRELRPGARAFIDCKTWNRPAIGFVSRAGFQRLTFGKLPAQGVADRRPPPPPSLWLVEISDEEAWHREASDFADHDYRQTWAWGSCSAIRMGARPEHVAVVDRHGDVVGLVGVRVKQVGGAVGIAYASAGPLVRRWADGGDLSLGRRRLTAVLRVLTAEYALRRRLVLRIVPSPATPDWADVQRQVFEAAGFAPTTRAPRQRTIIVDLDVEPEQLRASFAQKWRNCLNRAEREPLEVRAGRSAELLDNFLPLHDELVARKRFTPGLPAAFFAGVQRRLPPNSRFHVALADAEDMAVAGHVTALVGDTAVYVLGASNEEGRRRKAAYLLQWQAMAAARAAGCRWYDLGGVDPVANPDGYHFKRGVGGVDVTAAGPYEVRPPGLSGLAALAAEAAYHRLGRQLGRFSSRRE